MVKECRELFIIGVGEEGEGKGNRMQRDVEEESDTCYIYKRMEVSSRSGNRKQKHRRKERKWVRGRKLVRNDRGMLEGWGGGALE